MISINDRYHILVFGGIRDRDSEDLHAWAQPGRAPAERIPPARQGGAGEQVGDKVILEPLEKASFDVEAWRAELVAAGAREFLTEGLPEDEPTARDDDISFD